MQFCGKKTWYKKSTSKTFAKQGSNSTSWDIVGRELATMDELSQMEQGHCVLFIAGIGAFYSETYELKEHPNYQDMYEAWEDSTTDKKYNHLKELKCESNSTYKMLCDTGLSFAAPIQVSEIENVNKEEVKELFKSGILKLEDLRKEKS